MLCGSCFGAVTWGARMMGLVIAFYAQDAGDYTFQFFLLFGRARTWNAVAFVMYAIE